MIDIESLTPEESKRVLKIISKIGFTHRQRVGIALRSDTKSRSELSNLTSGTLHQVSVDINTLIVAGLVADDDGKYRWLKK
jgi:hypothetical protein